MLFFTYLATAQTKRTISGRITDSGNGETLIGANIYIVETQSGSVSNEYGFYSISLPEEKYTIQYSYLGFHIEEKKIDLKENIKLDIELIPQTTELQEVVVSSDAPNANVSNNEMSINKLDIATIQKMPSLLGEVEILRSIQLLPGVSSVGEGASGFNVRGGSIDQNLVLLDEAPVYNSSHLFGFFSVFNPDAIKDVKLYKGGIPARYGGRLSSILDVRMKDGNKKEFEMNGGIGTIFSRLSIEAPIVKDKASFIIAGRRSYIDVLAKPFLSDDVNDSVLNFYDLTLKANYNIDDKNKIYLSAYLGRDNFGFGDQAGFNWGNSTTTLRWNHLFSDKLFSNFTAYFSDYDYMINFGDESTNKFDWDASIKNYSFEPEFSLFLTPNNVIRFGALGIAYEFEPANAIGVSEGETLDLTLPKKYALEGAIFIENELDVSSQFSVNYGLRLSYFNYTGSGEAYYYGTAPVGRRRPVIGSESFGQWESIKTYANLEPRFALKYQLSDSKSIKLSYNRMSQYIHLISNTTAATPVDIWTPSTNNIQPQISDQIAVGYFQNFDNDIYELTTEIFYKRMDHLLDYIDGADLLINELLAGDIIEGRGRAFGWELMLKKNTGRLNGWLSYTLSRSERQVEGINSNRWYPSRYDQTHNLSISAFYDASKRWSFSGNFSLISGTPTTFPTTRFQQQGYILPDNGLDVRNNVRIPVYHRLDLSARIQGKKNDRRRWQWETVFSIYNVYSRRNAFSIYTRQTADGKTEAVRLSVIGNFIPSISANFKF